jgi:hypothetical protein
MAGENEVVAEVVTPVADPAPITPEAEEAERDQIFREYAEKADARLNDEQDHATDVGADPDEVVQDTPPTEKQDKAQPVAQGKPSEESGAAAATPAPEPAWIARLPEADRDAARASLKEADELRAKNAKLDQDYRSVSGRVAAYQRRYEDVKAQLPVVAQTAVAAAEKVETTAEWNDFAEQYPDVAKAIESRFPKGAGQDPTVQDIAGWVNEQRTERFLTEAYETVEAVHPGWRDQCKTKEFQEWKASSETYKRLAASDDISDAIALLDLYKALHPAQETPKPNANAVAATDAVAARRAAQVAGARAAKTERAAPNQNLDMNDGEQLFEFYSKAANERIRKRSR